MYIYIYICIHIYIYIRMYVYINAYTCIEREREREGGRERERPALWREGAGRTKCQASLATTTTYLCRPYPDARAHQQDADPSGTY